MPPVFTAALFKLPRHGSNLSDHQPDEWIKKMGHITYIYIYTHTHTHKHTYRHIHTHTMEYYSAINKNEILPFAATWIDMEGIILSEISQTEKDKYCILAFICGI